MTSRKKNSTAAYPDVQFVMDLALEKPGLRYQCTTYGKAINFKQRCNRYRNLLREIASESMIHIPGQRGASAYDVLVIRQVNEKNEPDRQGCFLLFEHERPEGKILDPESGEEIPFPKPGSLFND